MSGACAHVEGDWELFALGSLDEAAQREMESHLRSGCAECRQRYVEAHAALSALASAAPVREPSARVEHELMLRVRVPVPSPAVRAWPRWSFAPWALAAASLLLAVGMFEQNRRLSDQIQVAAHRPPLSENLGQPSVVPPPTSNSEERSDRPAITATAPPALAHGGHPAGSDNKRLADLESQLAELRTENASVKAASDAAQERLASLKTELIAAQTRSEALNRDLEIAKNHSNASIQSELASLNDQLTASRAEVARLAQIKTSNAQIERLLQSGSVAQVELRAVDAAAGKASARVLYSPKGGLLLVADSLPKLDHEKCYQLWLIRKGTPAILSAGLLQTSNDGHGFLLAPPGIELSQLTGLAITDEPKGGSVSARGRKLLFGAQ